jgi:hypothetical protein
MRVEVVMIPNRFNMELKCLPAASSQPAPYFAPVAPMKLNSTNSFP